MDNTSSTQLKHLLQKRITVVQLSQPHIHRRNEAELDIHTFKNHFMARLVSVDNKFTIFLWCRKGKQADITTNLLRTSITNPRLLAYAQIFGQFDSNTTPMAPRGGNST